MAISKERKKELVDQYKELVSKSPGMILASYSGLTVKGLEGLRGKIRELGGEFHIVKNRLVKLALQELNLPVPEGLQSGTTAIGFAGEEFPAVVRAVLELARETEVVSIKGGLVDGREYGARQMEKLAELPPLPVVQARFLGVLQAPASRMAGVLTASLRQVVNVIKAYAVSEATAPEAA